MIVEAYRPLLLSFRLSGHKEKVVHRELNSVNFRTVDFDLRDFVKVSCSMRYVVLRCPNNQIYEKRASSTGAILECANHSSYDVIDLFQVLS